MTAVPAAKLGCLRREYFGQDESQNANRPRHLLQWSGGGRRFTLGGHRLSSLYRTMNYKRLRLTGRYEAENAVSSWSKYSRSIG